MCDSALAPSPQRVVEAGDTVKLEFHGVTGKNYGDYLIQPGSTDPLSWSSKLKGKKAGDSVILPEAEQNEVTAVILGIDRP